MHIDLELSKYYTILYKNNIAQAAINFCLFELDHNNTTTINSIGFYLRAKFLEKNHSQRLLNHVNL